MNRFRYQSIHADVNLLTEVNPNDKESPELEDYFVPVHQEHYCSNQSPLD